MYLVVFAGNEEGGNSQQLEVGLADARGFANEHKVNYLGADVHGLLYHLEFSSHLQ